MSDTILHPVILAVPEADSRLTGREKVAALRGLARRALARSADYSGLALGPLDKDARGAPVPVNGIHWSLSHKETYVAAVCAPLSIGIDLEKIKPFSQALYQRIAEESEWSLAGFKNEILFFRIWTAKEAVLKAAGVGLSGLSRCRITAIVDDTHLILSYESSPWTVVQQWIDPAHLAAVTARGQDIVWHRR